MFPNLVTYHIHCQEPLPYSDALAYQYILAGNGLFIRTATTFFSVLMPIAKTTVRGLPSLAFEFQLKIPLLPVSLLSDVLTNARLARNADGRLNEVLYHRHHNGRSVQLIKPPQQTTAVSIAAPDASTNTLLCDLHSHGNMAAFWSSTDNAATHSSCVQASPPLRRHRPSRQPTRNPPPHRLLWLLVSAPTNGRFCPNPRPLPLHRPPHASTQTTANPAI